MSALKKSMMFLKSYDFLILPSAQVFPFDKNLQFPKKINNFELDTYHRWIEVFIMSSLLDLTNNYSTCWV